MNCMFKEAHEMYTIKKKEAEINRSNKNWIGYSVFKRFLYSLPLEKYGLITTKTYFSPATYSTIMKTWKKLYHIYWRYGTHFLLCLWNACVGAVEYSL